MSIEHILKEIDTKIANKEITAAQADQEIETCFKNLNTWDRVLLSRHPQRPYTLDYIQHGIKDFIEIHGDRKFADDPALVCGLGTTVHGNRKIMIIGHQKGRTTKEKIHRNFGMAKPEGYRKALRAMKLAERWNIPVLCLVDTPGAYPGIEGEERGQAEAIADNLLEMSKLKTSTIAVIIGEGGSGGALGIAVCDQVFMMEFATYSVISPESCASILWSDVSMAQTAAERLKITSQDVQKLPGIIHGIVKEPLGGAQRNHVLAAKNLFETVEIAYQNLEKKSDDQLMDERHQFLRNLGNFALV